MRYYAPDNNRNGKLAGIIALVCYLLLFLTLGLLVSFKMDYQQELQGILVDFGTDVDGEGDDNVMTADEMHNSTATETLSGDDIMTQNHEEAPALPSNERENTPNQTSTEIQQQNVNERALFPGSSASSAATSQGSSGEQGNPGHQTGSDGIATGTGTGTEGISFTLDGRRAVGSLPRPEYNSNAEGRVVIEITVDSHGVVQSASFRPQGSTTQDAKLREAAIKAARQTRFSPSEANPIQTGIITYVFRLQ